MRRIGESYYRRKEGRLPSGIALPRPAVGEMIAKVKAEIVYDVALGKVPWTVTRFHELHDHVDANEYGQPGIYYMSTEDVNAVQNTVDDWLANLGGKDSPDTLLRLAMAMHGDVEGAPFAIALDPEASVHDFMAAYGFEDGQTDWFSVGEEDEQEHIEVLAKKHALRRIELLVGDEKARAYGYLFRDHSVLLFVGGIWDALDASPDEKWFTNAPDPVVPA